MKTIEVYEKTFIYGTYDDTNYQVTEVYAGDKKVSDYDPKYYPPFSYGGQIVIDNSKSFDDIHFTKEDKEEQGVLITIYPPHGCKLVRNTDKDTYEYFD